MICDRNKRFFLFLINAWAVLLATVHLPAVLLISHELEESLALLQASIGAYLFTYAIFQIILVAILGVQRPVLSIFLGGIAAMTGCCICAIANTTEVFYVGRVLQAAGAATCVICVRLCAKSYLSANAASRFLAQMFVFTSLALLIGPLVSGFISSIAGWRPVFYLLSIWGLLNLGFLAGCFLPYIRNPSSQSENDLSRASILSFAACAMNPKFVLFTGYNIACYWAFYGFFSGMPLVVNYQNISAPEIVGLLSALPGLGAIIGGVIAARLARRFDPNQIIGVGLSLSFVGVGVAFGTIVTSSEIIIFELGIMGLFIGCTLGLVQPNALLCAMSVNDIHVPSAAALVGCTQIFFGSIASFIVPQLESSMTLFVIVLTAFSWLSISLWIYVGRTSKTT